MSIKKPYHRNYREMVNGPNSGYSSWGYIVDEKYSRNPEHYTRAFLMILEDLNKLFEFIEPADENMETYSFRIHELLMRTCIEVEANFKAILRENIYNPINREGKTIPENKWKMADYWKVNKTHHLSSYLIEAPIWHGEKKLFHPFKNWETNDPLDWYQAYNQSKHDRQDKFIKANFENLMNSVAGLLVLLTSQFKCEDFCPGTTGLAIQTDSYYSGSFGIGNYFIIHFPDDWRDDEKYDFDWGELRNSEDRFQKINYDEL